MPIDSVLFETWPTVSFPITSPNGKFVSYTIENSPQHCHTLVLKSVDKRWKKEIVNKSPAFASLITNDSKFALFYKGKDTLAIYLLGTSRSELISDVISFKYCGNNIGQWIAFQSKKDSGKLTLYNLNTRITRVIYNVVDYFFINNTEKLLIKTSDKEQSDTSQHLYLLDILTTKAVPIWHGDRAGGILIDQNKSQLAFVSADPVYGNSLWYYNLSMNKAELLIDSKKGVIDSLLKIERIAEFSADGKLLFFVLKNETLSRPIGNGVMVDIWSSSDAKLQSRQLTEGGNGHSYKAFINVSNRKFIRLEFENEFCSNVGTKFSLVYHRNGDADGSEMIWNPAYKHSIYLVNNLDGSRKEVSTNSSFFYVLSPGEKYLYYFDYKQKNFFVYNIATGQFHNITNDISTTWTQYGNDQPDGLLGMNATPFWTAGDSEVLLPDQNDIWLIDPAGLKKTLNVTNSYGRNNNIVFRIANYKAGETVDLSRPIIFCAFDRITKENGFFSKMLKSNTDPLKLTMGPYIYYSPDNSLGMLPIEVRKHSTYIVKRESAKASPNYYITNDFIHFQDLTEVYPERKYLWFSNELIRWKTFNGTYTDGILYKPHDFDPNKKYPIIFHYYDKESKRLNKFLVPGLSHGDINIPWFVSHGYLVFTPDINFVVGAPGESVMNSILSAVEYFSKKGYVNMHKMGLQGFSFGGFHTNYLVTHSKIFAAAMSGAGSTDLISFYGKVNSESGVSNQQYSEIGQLRLGTTLWENPDVYIKNSPIFNAHEVTTPLLMLNNMGDAATDFSQAVEFFTALRRLNKRVWLLQYDNNGHGVYGKAAIDYTIRLTQFFDHYLQDKPAPRWMLNGIPFSKKGIDDGFELDSSGRTPGAGIKF